MDFYALQDSLRHGAHIGHSSDLVQIESRYTLIEKIGSGSYGDVWSATRRSGAKGQYAVKRIDTRATGAKGLRSIMGEVETMSMLSHPNIVKLEETYQDEAFLWIVMEHLPGDSLQHRLDRERLSEAETLRFVTQLLMAIEYIHGKGIVHRDLKPSNCLLSREDVVVKIADFGLSVFAGSEQCLTGQCGTLRYMAPEILLDSHYGKPVDMWALGVMTHVMAFGSYPFNGQSEAALSREICRGFRPAWEAEEGGAAGSASMRDFVCQLLTSDPNRRPTAAEALKHPWIKAGMELTRSSSFSATRLPSATLMGPLGRWRAAVLAVIATHRFLYFARVRRLARLGYGHIPLLRDYHYLLTGCYDPPGDSLDCSNMFQANPMALVELVAMIGSCSHLRHVDVSFNNIHSLSLIQTFLKAVAKHPSLRSIDLSHNPIPSVAGRALLRLARSPLSHITTINVGDTAITADTIGQINAFLREKLASAAGTSQGSSLADLPSRSLSLSPAESQFSSSTSSTPNGLRPRRSHLPLHLPKRMSEKAHRATRLPPLARLPPLRHADKAE